MTTRTERRLAKKQNRNRPATLQLVPHDKWSDSMKESDSLVSVWCSRDYLVQAYTEPGDIIRLSICSTTPTAHSWADGLTWDDLQEIKRQVGLADQVAVEVYPNDANIIHDANMRHLWVLPEPPDFMWRKG